MPRRIPVAVALGLVSILAMSCTAPPPGPDVTSKGGAPAPLGECKLQWREPTDSGDVVAPFSLTSSEGIGLELLSLRSRAVVADPLAFTELHMVFQNPQDRQIEGRFEISLPPGAAISRFAMKIDGDWQEAEVVELQAARRAYEDALHRRQDPALLEKNAGNRFSARVFPIPARAVKEIIVSYSEALPSNSEPYRLLLRGLPTLKDLDVDVVVPRASGPEHLTLREQNFMPQKDLELTMGRRSAEVGLRYDRLAVARIAPDLKLPAEPISGVTLLFDTSASRAIDFKGQVARLGKILAELRAAAGNDFDLRVLCFDQTVLPVFSGKASSFSADAQQAILQRNALGASDLTGALRYLKEHPARHERVIVVSDGILTAGALERDQLKAAAAELKQVGVQRIDAIVDGGIQDEISLEQLTVAGLDRDGIVVRASLPAPLLASRIIRATRSGLKVKVPGATWVWPETLDAVQPGDQVLVFADLPPGTPMKVELGEKGEDLREVGLTDAERPLLERAWVKANIDRLSANPGTTPAEKSEVRKQILDLSTKYRVLSDYTALLVLETDWDYQRFGIDRTALAEILTVGPAGITTIDRRRMPTKNAMPVVTAIREEEDVGLIDSLFGDKKKSDRRENDVAAAPPAFAGAEAPESEARIERDDAADGVGGEGQRHRGEEGRMGRPTAAAASPSEAMAPGAPADARPDPSPAPMAEPEARPERIIVEETVEAKADTKSAPMAASRRPEPLRSMPRPIPRPMPPPPPLSDIPGGPLQPTQRPPERPKPADAYEGRFAVVMQQVIQGNQGGALREAWTWREQNPGDELALLALGSAGLGLAVDTFAQAVAQRPDHPSSHRLYAFALVKAGRHAEAFAAALVGARQSYPWGRFAGAPRILDEDLRLIAAAWLAASPQDEKTIRAELAAANIVPDTSPSLRFVLNWETDANDVDFHIYDGRGGHAFYSNRSLPSGGELYADVTTGYGPECFTIPGQAAAFPYTLQGHYYSRGPMGYGMGKLEVIEHDGLGHLRFKEHPFVIMKDSAFVDLGLLAAPLAQQGESARLQPVTAEKTPSGGSYTPPAPVQPATLPPTRF